jgi:lipid-binding SYLF domain-containing protein
MRKNPKLFRTGMKIASGTLGSMLLLSVAGFASEVGDRKKQEERLQNSGTVLSEILGMPESIPKNLLDKAKCVVVIPSVLKAAFVMGGTYGRGAMVCRGGEDFTGAWRAPVMVGLEGGSIGFQLGGEATDLVLLIMNERGATSLLHSKVKIGADVSATAGPVGRTAEADTDAYLRSEILTYSRARGLFAGVSLEGAALHPDNDANEALYGRKIEAREIVRGPEPRAPQAAERLISQLDRISPNRKSE